MTCPSCQHANPPESNFCLGCGARLAVACASCGTPLPAGSRFCNKCGTPVTAETGALVRLTSPETYTPKHLAEKILTSKAALEGERKQVTVLFADLKGSMERLADRDPEDARKLLDPVIEHMMEAVHRYEGTVNQVMGDGIMALFGAPLAHEDHAVRACYAALRMQASVRRYGEEVHRTEGVPVQIRVGLHSGDVVVRSIGSDLRMDYSAVGQTTHLAARMEHMAVPGTILISADTLRIAEDYVRVHPLGSRSVKGLSEPMEVYELTGAGPARSRLQASAARGLTRLTGRGHEMQVVREALRRADSGRGQVLVIAGDPGVGKSRLVWETTHSHHIQGWLVLEARSVSYGRGSAYLPVLELLRAYFAIEDRDETRKIQEKVTSKLLTLDRALEPALPALLSLLDVPIEDRAWERLDPPQRRQQTLDALRGLLLRESRVQPLLLVFEDLHWIDGQTQAVLDSLVESLPTARALLLATHRPEYEHRWGAKTYCTPLRLDPLPTEGARELLDGLLGDHPSVEPAKAVLIGRTEGNPFFLEESVRSLVETGALAGERGAHCLVRELPSIQIPATVQAVLAARIDRLPAKEKHLLEVAAVVGKDVPLPLLAAIADQPEGELRRGLSYLQTAEFLYETALFPNPEFAFKHPLTHEVVLRNLLHERQRALSSRLVDTIERMYPDRVGEYTEILAYQAGRGELWGKAVSYSRQSGVKAASRAANHEAVACLEHALTALEHVPDDRDRQHQAVDIRLELAAPLFGLAELRRRSQYLREAEQLVGPLEDQTRASRAWSRLAHQLWIEGDPEAALECARRAVTGAEGVATPELRVPARLVLGQIHHARGDLAEAITVLLGTLEVLEGYSSGYPALGSLNPVSTLTWLAWAHADLGAFSEGDAFAREAVRIAEITNQSYFLVHAYFGQGLCRMLRGDIVNALPVLEGGLRLSLDADIPISFCLIAPVAGAVYTLSGRSEDGIALLRKAFEDTASYGAGHYQARRLTFLGEAYLLAGRLEEATNTAERALELAQRQ